MSITTKTEHNTAILSRKTHLLQGMALGLIALLTNYASLISDHPSLTVVSAIILYFAVLLHQSFAGISTALTFSALFLLPESLSLGNIRILVATILLLLTRHWVRQLPPAIVHLAFWGLILGTPPLRTIILNEQSQSESFSAIITLAIETIAIILITLALTSEKITSYFSRQAIEISALNFFIQITALPVITCSVITLMAGVYLSDSSLEKFIQNITPNNSSVVILFVALLILTLIFGFLFTAIFNKFTAQLTALSKPDRTILGAIETPPAITEWVNTIESVQLNSIAVANELRDLRYEKKTLLKKNSELHGWGDSLAEQNDSLKKILDNAPYAVAILNARGHILQSNRLFARYLGLVTGIAPGSDFHTLPDNSPWTIELKKFIAQIYNSLNELKDSVILEFDTSNIEERYLRATAQLERVPATSTVKADREQIVLFIEQQLDHRNFTINLLQPSQIEKLGAKAIDILKELMEAMHTLTDDKANNQQNLKPSAAAVQAIVAMKEVKSNIARHYGNYLELIRHYSNLPVESELINVSQEVRNGIYWGFRWNSTDDLLLLNELFGSTEHTGPEAGDSSNDIFIWGATAEFHRLLAMLISFINSVDAQPHQVDLNCGNESIGSGTAHMIPGTAPGQYARIRLNFASGVHLPRTSHNVDLNTLNRIMKNTAPEVILQFLSIQTKRMGGLLSLQSNISSGNVLTLYLPQRPELNKRYPRELREYQVRKQELATGICPELSEKTILIFSSRDSTLIDSTQLLASVGASAMSEHLNILYKELEQPVQAFGAGFDAEGSSNALMNVTTSSADLVALELSEIDDSSKLIIRLIEEKYEKSCLLLFSNQIIPGDEINSRWKRFPLSPSANDFVSTLQQAVLYGCRRDIKQSPEN
ncbi:MAG: hypothetical protein PHC51_13020 [bacterium]|nr:hypothetical protein [bacterium]